MSKRKGNREVRKPKQVKAEKTEASSVAALNARPSMPGKKK